jgi:beta-galactosidase
VTVEAVDSNDRPDLRADQEIQFEISGPGTIAAVGNGDGQDPDSYYSNRRKLYQGRALVVIRSSKQSGPLKLGAKGSGLRDGLLTIVAKAAQLRPELQ